MPDLVILRDSPYTLAQAIRADSFRAVIYVFIFQRWLPASVAVDRLTFDAHIPLNGDKEDLFFLTISA